MLYANSEDERYFVRAVSHHWNLHNTAMTHLGSNKSKPWHMSMQKRILHSEKQREKHVWASAECHGWVLLDCGVTADAGNVSWGASC